LLGLLKKRLLSLRKPPQKLEKAHFSSAGESCRATRERRRTTTTITTTVMVMMTRPVPPLETWRPPT